MEDSYIGKMLDNRYELLARIGAGGMAVVYKARDHRLNRVVAVKILKGELSQNEDLRRSFRAESQAIAMLSSPNIVAVYDVNSDGSTDYIVMELIEGITLKQYISRKGVLTWKETLHFASQIALGLSHAHAKGIIHRDIKPHNIMILRDGSAKVTDFGIARLVSAQRTMTQHAMGSVHYMSPEQAKGTALDTRSDIYSLGVVMYEMITNTLPFDGDSPVSIALQHISSVPQAPRELNPSMPVGMEQIVMHAMAADPDDRYASAEELLRDLEELKRNPGKVFHFVPAQPAADSFDKTVPLSKVVRPVRVAAETQRRTLADVRHPRVTKEEYRTNRKRNRNAAIFVGSALVLALLVGLFVFSYHFFLRDVFDPEEERVQVPNFMGMWFDDVIASNVYAQYYDFSVVTATSDLYEKGKVMDQDVVPGNSMVVQSNGIRVQLTVSEGPAVTLMPELRNKDYREAEIILEALKLELDIQINYDYSDDYTSGMVFEQYPAEGTELVRGGKVYFTYSIGREQKTTTVPSVLTLTERQAIARLGSYLLSYAVDYEYSDQESGTVIYQSVEPNELVPVYMEIRLIVSLGPDPNAGTEVPPVSEQETEPQGPGGGLLTE